MHVSITKSDNTRYYKITFTLIYFQVYSMLRLFKFFIGDTGTMKKLEQVKHMQQYKTSPQNSQGRHFNFSPAFSKLKK